MTKQRPLPMRQGNQIQFYTYALLAANLNQAAEGTVNKPAVLKFAQIRQYLYANVA
jgi:hypothetical protein